MRSRPNAQPNQSLIDGIITLQALATSPEPIGCRELARRLGFEPTRVNRLLKTLAYLGIARQTANRKYTGGPGMHVLAAQALFASGLVRRAVPALEELRRFGHTVAMGVLWRDSVSYLYHAPPGVQTSDALGRIGLYPASTGGIGMALLAQLDDAQVRETYEGHEVPHYANVETLLSEIHLTRARGFARVRVREDTDQHTVAVPVGTPTHSAIGVYGWIPEAAVPEIVEALRHAAARIEAFDSP